MLSLASFDPTTATPDVLRAAQIQLAKAGFYSGKIDGDWGPLSRAALAKWEAAHPADTLDGIPLYAMGKVSWFGGPADRGVRPDEGLGLYQQVSQNPGLFLPTQPRGTTGLARRLNPAKNYFACRFNNNSPDYPKMTREHPALFVNPKTGKQAVGWPADWGPNQNTDRVADLSPGLLDELGAATDDILYVYWPAPVNYEEVLEAAA